MKVLISCKANNNNNNNHNWPHTFKR